MWLPPRDVEGHGRVAPVIGECHTSAIPVLVAGRRVRWPRRRNIWVVVAKERQYRREVVVGPCVDAKFERPEVAITSLLQRWCPLLLLPQLSLGRHLLRKWPCFPF